MPKGRTATFSKNAKSKSFFFKIMMFRFINLYIFFFDTYLLFLLNPVITRRLKNYDCLNVKTYLLESEDVQGSNTYFFLIKEMEIVFNARLIKSLKLSPTE